MGMNCPSFAMCFRSLQKQSSNCIPLTVVILHFLISGIAYSQSSTSGPRVVIPNGMRIVPPKTTASSTQTTAPADRITYPWKLNITSTAFWIGEQPTQNNPVPNHVSSWDGNWQANYGGYDDPDPMKRIASHSSGEFRPKNFIPKLNPFYVALPYNDRQRGGYRPEASKVIPWFHRVKKDDGSSTLKGRWIQVYSNNRSCYAQWEDVGPFVVDDWPYVFGDKRPVNTNNRGAAIDISPAVRDYLGIPNSSQLHWRFVEDSQVPFGPWKKYGPKANAAPHQPDLDAQQRYFEYLRKMRDEQFRRKTKTQLENGQ
ncbi:MAG: hypothetical protein RLZZ553_1441 [Verrucomicrobiota bacterium]